MLTCLKDRFSLPAGSHYLNCAYMSPLSKRVVEAGEWGIRRKTVPYEIHATDFFEGVQRVRTLFAQLINAPDPRRIAVVPSASYGLSQVASNTPITRGQKIVIAHEQFPSNVYIWWRLAERTEAQVEVVRPPDDAVSRGAAWNEALLESVDERTAVVAIGQVHWTDGTLFDLAAIRERTRAVGAALVVDGTQSVGAIPFDVQQLQPDALVVAAYKWLMGPYSIGAAYYGRLYDDGVPLEETWMGREGSENFGRLVDYNSSHRPLAVRYDMGEVSNFILVPMFIAALEQVLDWQPARIEQYARSLSGGLIDRLRSAGYAVTDDRWRRGHLFGVRPPASVDFAALHERLQERRVFVSVRGSALRVSVHAFNDASDLDALGDALEVR